MWRDDDGGVSDAGLKRWQDATEPHFVEVGNDQEPCHVADRRSTTRHDPRTGWLHWKFGCGPNADKLSQVREQRRLTQFKVLPDAHLLRCHGWNRSLLDPHVAKWKAHQHPTPTLTRRHATSRDAERACQLHETWNFCP